MVTPRPGLSRESATLALVDGDVSFFGCDLKLAARRSASRTASSFAARMPPPGSSPTGRTGRRLARHHTADIVALSLPQLSSARPFPRAGWISPVAGCLWGGGYACPDVRPRRSSDGPGRPGPRPETTASRRMGHAPVQRHLALRQLWISRLMVGTQRPCICCRRLVPGRRPDAVHRERR